MSDTAVVSNNGGKEPSSISVAKLDFSACRMNAQPNVRKPRNAKSKTTFASDPGWNPNSRPILIEVITGDLKIHVNGNQNANPESFAAGTQILLLDFKPDKPIVNGVENYGHITEAGAKGYELRVTLIECDDDFIQSILTSVHKSK